MSRVISRQLSTHMLYTHVNECCVSIVCCAVFVLDYGFSLNCNKVVSK